MECEGRLPVVRRETDGMERRILTREHSTSFALSLALPLSRLTRSRVFESFVVEKLFNVSSDSRGSKGENMSCLTFISCSQHS